MAAVHVLYFAQAARLVGQESEEVQWSGGSAAQLADHLLILHPELAPISSTWRLAWNEEFVDEETPIDGGTFAVMPPFSGG